MAIWIIGDTDGAPSKGGLVIGFGAESVWIENMQRSVTEEIKLSTIDAVEIERP